MADDDLDDYVLRRGLLGLRHDVAGEGPGWVDDDDLLDDLMHLRPLRPCRITRDEQRRVDKTNVLMKMYDVRGHVDYIVTPPGRPFRRGKPFVVYYEMRMGFVRKQFRRIEDVERFCQILFRRAQWSNG